MEESYAIVTAADVKALAETLKKIEAFQALVRSQLNEGTDYGVIPGCGSKPALLKPGAEKLLMLLGLRSRYEVIRSQEDFERGFFFYIVRCSLSHGANDVVVAEGLGSCNTAEGRFRRRDGSWQDPYTGANVALKMARKRALVDAALTVGSLSNLFTQDIEDFAGNGSSSAQSRPGPRQTDPGGGAAGTITEAQRRKIFAAAREIDLSDNDLRRHMADAYGTDSTAQLTRAQASELIDWIEGGAQDMPLTGTGA